MMAKSGNRTYGKRDAGVGVQDAGGRSFGVPGSGGLFRITGAGGKNGGKVRVRFRGQWFVRGMLWKRNRSISFHFVC